MNTTTLQLVAIYNTPTTSTLVHIKLRATHASLTFLTQILNYRSDSYAYWTVHHLDI